jgi:hypothetical protein
LEPGPPTPADLPFVRCQARSRDTAAG